MEPTVVRSTIKAARRRGRLWVRLLDSARLLASSEGRSVLWTRIVYRREVHQTTSYTCDERYPALFDLAAKLAPSADRILSFGCSTGEELMALRRRFPGADVVGAEINPRSRRIAIRRLAKDARTLVVHPRSRTGEFDLVFALAVLQREPHLIADMAVRNLSPFYPFDRFDAAVCELAEALRPGGLLCVTNAHYRVEDSSIAPLLEAVVESPLMAGPLFGPDGRLLEGAVARTIFQKQCRRSLERSSLGDSADSGN